MKQLVGKIHSIESFGTVDGPGIRYVVFLQGCPLRCLYCHNPDSWQMGDEKFEIGSSELLADVLKHKNFYSPKGGLTFSGGEPLMQLDFMREVVSLLKHERIHTTIDTSGALFSRDNPSMAQFFKEEIDLTLLDIKAFNEQDYKKITGGRLQPTLDLLEFLSEHDRPVWVRYVVVPGLTDSLSEVERLSRYLSPFKNIVQVEVLPFHKMGEFKWKELGLDYQLKESPPCPVELNNSIRDLFIAHGLKAR